MRLTLQMSRAPSLFSNASAPFASWTALSRFPEFFSNDSTDRVSIETVSRPPKMVSKRLIDHRLVAPTCGVRAFSKGVEHVVVEVNRDAGLSPLPNHWAALAFGEVVFLLHIDVFRSASRAAPR